MDASIIQVLPVAVSEPPVAALLDALTSEIAIEGYTAEQTFGYTPEELHSANVYMVGARVDGALRGVGGLELQAGGAGSSRSPASALTSRVRHRYAWSLRSFDGH